jgi:hypothetical protein
VTKAFILSVAIMILLPNHYDFLITLGLAELGQQLRIHPRVHSNPNWPINFEFLNLEC